LPGNAVATEDAKPSQEAAIPGLDFSDENTTTTAASVMDVSRSIPETKSVVSTRRKPIYTKPVPRAFEKAWAEGRETAAVTSNSHPSHPHETSIGLLGESPGQL